MHSFVQGRLAGHDSKITALSVLAVICALNFGVHAVRSLYPSEMWAPAPASLTTSAGVPIAEARPAPDYVLMASFPAPVAKPAPRPIAEAAPPDPVEPVAPVQPEAPTEALATRDAAVNAGGLTAVEPPALEPSTAN